MQIHFQRAACSLLIQALVCAQATSAAAAIWPAPMPEPVAPTAPMRQQVQMQTQPNFQAPSATHCQRNIETRELSDGQARPTPLALGSLLKKERAPAADARYESETAHAPLYLAPAPATATAPALRAESKAAGSDTRMAPSNIVQQSTGPVTAGMVDDNAAFSEYLAFRKRNQQVPNLSLIHI